MEISRSLESDKKRPSRRARALQFTGSFQFAFLSFPLPVERYLLIYFASHFGGRLAGGFPLPVLCSRVRCVRITRSYTKAQVRTSPR
jgi:hypothetical protein